MILFFALVACGVAHYCPEFLRVQRYATIYTYSMLAELTVEIVACVISSRRRSDVKETQE